MISVYNLKFPLKKMSVETKRKMQSTNMFIFSLSYFYHETQNYVSSRDGQFRIPNQKDVNPKLSKSKMPIQIG